MAVTRLIPVGDGYFEPYAEEEIIYIDGGIPRDEVGYFSNQVYSEYRGVEPPMLDVAGDTIFFGGKPLKFDLYEYLRTY